ncbi:MAG TPA: glycoside hydrolase family 38 C-terminal domain-containing protein [Ktedonobacterales bacterium]
MASPRDGAATATDAAISTAIAPPRTTLFVVAHTHWDREWYQTFQQFRLRLVRAVDLVLDTLERDPAFTCFMLDGQTIVLEDYLDVRPENAARLQALARAGRLLTGPWYVQPDEFLAGGESLIRNLQIGRRMAQAYGGAMGVGYLPDSFGHLAQLPQLLRGFALDNAVFWRGVGPQITRSRFRWTAPDGSEVVALWLGDQFGYSDGANLPLEADALAARIGQLAEQLRARAPQDLQDSLLLMNGSDHVEPQVGLPAAMEAANERLREEGLVLRIAPLPEYVARARNSMNGASAEPRHVGELRSGRYSPLLPGVLSTRICLKQRNAACEAQLVRWAEPHTAWAAAMGARHPTRLMELAWKYLLPNSAHDSICGCGIDQVHREMLPRFDQSEQVASALADEALAAICEQVDTRGSQGAVPVVIFNAGDGSQSAPVTCRAHLPAAHVEVVDTAGTVLPHEVLSSRSEELLSTEVEVMLAVAMMGMVSEGRVMGYTITGVQVRPTEDPSVVAVDVTVTEQGEPDLASIERVSGELLEMATRGDIVRFRLSARAAPRSELRLLARDVPAHGGRVFWIRSAPSFTDDSTKDDSTKDDSTKDDGAFVAGSQSGGVMASALLLENAYLRVTVDPEVGTLTLTDKRTGIEYQGLNAVLDGGDVGDLYNYCPPAQDRLVRRPSHPPRIELVTASSLSAALRITRVFELPAACAEDRIGRAEQTVPCTVVSEVSLTADARRVEIRTTVENAARDHRLRVLFPLPFAAGEADAEGSFEVACRPAQPEPIDEASREQWIEQPVATQPQKRFVDVSNGAHGLALLNRGLPEYELMAAQGGEGNGLALTLLRSVEWLSRADLATRRGHAGPMLHTPEAQGLGSHVFEYALVPHEGAWHDEEALVMREAQAFEAPLRAMATVQHSGTLPSEWSFVRMEPASVVVSAVKRSEGGDGVVVRVYNPRDVAQQTKVIFALPFAEALATNLDEEPLPANAQAEPTALVEGGLRYELRPGEIRTLLLRQ